jgi:hypothetical protein
MHVIRDLTIIHGTHTLPNESKFIFCIILC